ncbi:MAG: glycosyltransferase family 1 protein [Ruminococcaceae bacterium]|nr:glycosyltransferase family 1 protein [Oscillospiraceae bacterium]
MRKIKVLHIIPTFSSGGAERVLLGYMKDFKNDAEIEMHALALAKDENSIFDNEIKNSGLNIKYAEIDANEKLSVLKRILAIRREIKRLKPDIIHSHLRITFYVSLASLFLNVKHFIHTIHTVPQLESNGKLFIFDKFCYKYLSVFPICLNKELARTAEKFYDIPFCEYLYNGIDISKYSGFKGTKELRDKYKIPQDAYLLGHIGRFADIKNHDFIIDVFNELKKQKDNAYLLLIGEGPLMQKIKDKCKKLGIEERVIFAGTCTNVHEMLQIMNGFIFPSKQEGLGIALIEAQAAGLYCVVSDTIPSEAFVSGRLASLPLNAGPSKWVEALLKEEASTDIRNELRAFSIEGVNDRLRQIYKNSIKT